MGRPVSGSTAPVFRRFRRSTSRSVPSRLCGCGRTNWWMRRATASRHRLAIGLFRRRYPGRSFTMNESIVREQISKLQDWGDAHVNFDGAIAGVPVEMRGSKAPGFPHSLWDLVEHLRRAQWDILDFCRNPDYKEMPWPEAYW